MSSDPKWYEEREKALAEGDTWPRTKTADFDEDDEETDEDEQNNNLN